MVLNLSRSCCLWHRLPCNLKSGEFLPGSSVSTCCPGEVTLPRFSPAGNIPESLSALLLSSEYLGQLLILYANLKPRQSPGEAQS